MCLKKLRTFFFFSPVSFMVHLLNLKSKLKEGLRGFDLEMFRESYQKPRTSDSYRIGASSFHTYNTTIFKKNKKPYERLEK